MSLVLYEQQARAERALLPLMRALHAALMKGPAPPALLRALRALGIMQATEPATEAVSSTVASLTRAPPLAVVSQRVGVKIAAEKAGGLAERAAAVLIGKSEAVVSPYTRLAAQVLIFDSARAGSEAGAQAGGATHKTFIRVRKVLEPRAHSSLEGLTIPIDDLFNIGGYRVYGPGDAALPWSERAWCSHVCRYE